MAETWLKCTACRTDLPFNSKYFQCSVSTCNRSRMRLVFCSVACWDSHLADARHRDAWAEDKIAPSQAAWQRELADQAAVPDKPSSAPASAPVSSTSAPRPPAAVGVAAPIRRVVGEPVSTPAPAPAAGDVRLSDVADRDMLIVISKLKKYIKDRSGMNCSDAVADVLSDHVRTLCDDSIRAAGRDERKTVLDRDVPRPRR
jgi:hypothetical protein